YRSANAPCKPLGTGRTTKATARRGLTRDPNGLDARPTGRRLPTGHPSETVGEGDLRLLNFRPRRGNEITRGPDGRRARAYGATSFPCHGLAHAANGGMDKRSRSRGA